ncbi:MAG: protein-L-isoaspartate(D-aspartate) O-methyltransferase, partial [Pirellulaceae bacterium]
RQIQPDPTEPAIVNGPFETNVPPGDAIPGWYYHRQVTWHVEADHPDRGHVALFQNSEPGRAAHMLQGLAIDGRFVPEIELSAWVRYRQVVNPPQNESFPAVAITFYDEQRRDLGHHWLGPFRGTAEWKQVARRFRVPPTAREAIVRLGLFGATGELACDDVRIQSIRD